MLQVSGNALHRVESSSTQGWYLRVTEGGARRLIQGLAKLTHSLRELYRYVFTKWEFSNAAKPSVFKSVFVPIHTYGHESWVMTERISSQVQAEEMGLLRRDHGATQGRTKVRWRSEQETSLARPSLNLRSFGSKCTVLKKKLATFWDFSAPPVIRSPGQFACLAPLVTPLVRHFAKACAAVKFTKP